MLVSCKFCGLMHRRGHTCPKRINTIRTKENNYITRFRSNSTWQRKREEIKKRDQFLCQVCLLDKYFTERIYNTKNLEVHHIDSISKKWEKRLQNDNLVTLCSFHHRMADMGEIPKDFLISIVRKREKLV
jgi:5-methylcytosine-specific restriction protein A